IVAPTVKADIKPTKSSNRIAENAQKAKEHVSKKREEPIQDDIAEDPSGEEDEGKKKTEVKTAGIEQATMALLGSIQTVFVLHDRPFMAGFLQEFKNFSGCKLGKTMTIIVTKVYYKHGDYSISTYRTFDEFIVDITKERDGEYGEREDLLSMDPERAYEKIIRQGREIISDQGGYGIVSIVITRGDHKLYA
ncbi:hypothetical protein HDU96_011042, partial [Phlyctochytrium bullatum]